MAQAVERNGVAFNMGAKPPMGRRLRGSSETWPTAASWATSRRSITYNMDPIFISGSHWFDLINWINCDRRAVSVQAT